MAKGKLTGGLIGMMIFLMGTGGRGEGGVIETYFSPRGGCTEAIIKEINSAKSSIAVQAYSFTSAPIAKAIVTAQRRGVKVTAILDTSIRASERFNLGPLT